MSTGIENILIFGATGLIGTHIANAILTTKHKFGRIGIFTSQDTVSTKSDKIQRLRKEGAEIIVGNLASKSDVSEAYDGFGTVVSCVGRAAIQIQLQLIQLADDHSDIRRFFPSEYGTDIEYSPSSINEKPHQQKLKVRELLKTIKNLDYTYVVTGPYGDADRSLYLAAKKPEDEEEGNFDVKGQRAVLLGDGEGKISLTTMRDVGRLVVAALLHPDAVKNKAIHVNSFTTTPHELVAEFEKQTHRKWDVVYTSLDRLRYIENEAYEKGSPRAGAITRRRIWASGGTLYDKRDNHLIGMEETVDSMEDAVHQAIQVQEAMS